MVLHPSVPSAQNVVVVLPGETDNSNQALRYAICNAAGRRQRLGLFVLIEFLCIHSFIAI